MIEVKVSIQETSSGVKIMIGRSGNDITQLEQTVSDVVRCVMGDALDSIMEKFTKDHPEASAEKMVSDNADLIKEKWDRNN